MHACLLAQLCPILWDPLDCSPPGSSIHGISQASILESVAIPFSWGSSQPRDWTRVFCIGRQIFYGLGHQGSPCMYTQSLHLGPNICDSMDCGLPGSSVHGVFPAWILEWVAMPFLQGIFLTQGSSSHLLHFLHCRWILYWWATGEVQGSPVIPKY